MLKWLKRVRLMKSPMLKRLRNRRLKAKRKSNYRTPPVPLLVHLWHTWSQNGASKIQGVFKINRCNIFNNSVEKR
jgi:hypothetical protein